MLERLIVTRIAATASDDGLAFGQLGLTQSTACGEGSPQLSWQLYSASDMSSARLRMSPRGQSESKTSPETAWRARAPARRHCLASMVELEEKMGNNSYSVVVRCLDQASPVYMLNDQEGPRATARSDLPYDRHARSETASSGGGRRRRVIYPWSHGRHPH